MANAASHRRGVEEDAYIDLLNDFVRGINRHLKMHDAPLREYSGGPRHVREAIRHYDGAELRELVILNVGMGDCGWNNCRMCGLSTRAEKLTEEEVESEIRELSKLPHLSQKGIKSLYISPYSFFSDVEMTEKSRKKVYDLLNGHENLEYAVFMSRPNYVSKDKLDRLRGSLKSQKVIVWMGLETTDPFISRYCIDKGYVFEDVERASEMLKQHEIRPGVWILQKPPFLSEREGIEDAVKSIRTCLDRGYEIRLMPNEVMDYTLTKLLFDMKRYRPPWLWSVIEVLRRFSGEEHMRIDVSGPHFERDWSVVPREIHSSEILAFPSNCPQCTPDVMKAIQRYNMSKDVGVFDGLDCSCRRRWQKELDVRLPTLKERIAGDFSDIIKYFLEQEALHGGT